MLAILSITLPVFAAVALGYGCTRGGLFKPSDMRLLGSFVMNLALPALLFREVATRHVSEVFDLTYMLIYAIGALLAGAVLFTALSLARVSPTRRAVAVMGTTCPNSGFVGYPLMLLALPDLAGQILALNMLTELFVIIPINLVLFELAKSSEGSKPLHVLSNAMISIFRRPLVIAILFGLTVSLAGLPLSQPLLRTVDIFAASAAALALFSIGGALVGLPFKGHRALASVTAASKLLLQPAMVALALLLIPALGLAPLSLEMRAAIILSAAIPMFSIYALFAAELGHEGMASIAQIIATGFSFISLSALMLWLL